MNNKRNHDNIIYYIALLENNNHVINLLLLKYIFIRKQQNKLNFVSYIEYTAQQLFKK